MLDATTEDFGIGGQTTYLLGENIHQLRLCVRPAIGEMFLEVIPDTFVGIQFGGIGRKAYEVEAAGAKQQFLDWIAAMYLAIVPQDDYVAPDLMQKVPQEQRRLFAVDVILEQLAVQGAVEPPRTYGDARDGGDAVVTVTMAHDRRLTDGAPGLVDTGNQEEAGFVDEDDVGCQPRGVFFTAGQTARFH